ncbi:MAG: RICIN domain-containing protein [Prolixibacteraceae bacterium]|jgi:hypothetical protein
MKAKRIRSIILTILPIVIGLSIVVNFLLPETELGKVIRHYKKEQNEEKLAAARFLIDNMEGRYSYNGEAYGLTRAAYSHLSLVSESERNETIKNGLDTLQYVSELTVEFDKDSIKADFLIKHIDFAYDVWKKAPWNKDVNFNNFCEYILPYKYNTEGISEFIEPYNKIYSQMLECIYFEGGNRYNAVNQDHEASSLIKKKDNSSDALIRLLPDKNKLVFNNIENGKEGTKTLFIQYTNVKHWSKMKILINDKDTLYASLKPLNSLQDFPKRPLKIPVQLKQGLNSIEIAACEDTIAIDYIEIVPFEKYYGDDVNYKIVDGANYIISNAANNKCLEIENGSSLNDALLYYNDYKGEKYQHFNIQNVDYGFFKLSPCHIEGKQKCLDVAWLSKSNNAIIHMWDFQKQSNQLWTIIPVGHEKYKIMNKLCGKCLEISSKNNQVVQNDYMGSESQHWIFKRADNNIYFDKNFHTTQNSALEATRRIAKELDFDWKYLESNLPELPALDILNTKIGNCVVEAQFQLSILRSLGIPAVIDFYPPGANVTVIHEFNSIIDKDNHAIHCQVGVIPGTGNIEMPASKVFRKNFSINKNSLALKKGRNERIPSLFRDTHLLDVTAEYCATTDVDVDLFKTDGANYKHVYLCVFNNNNWLPVCWDRISNNKCTFKDMGLGVLYLPAFYTNEGNITASGYPFIINNDSTIKKIVVSKDTIQTLILKRKYPWNIGGWFDGRMNEGKFQGANKADFSDAVTLYTFKGNTKPIFYNLPVQCSKKFTYARFCGANGTNSTLSELMFLNENGIEIQGNPIGTPGSYMDAGNTIDKAFDKNILTFYEGVKPDSTWVGLKFGKPEVVKTIRFIPRNDGNCVEIGDNYELEYWNNKEWESLGNQVAKTDSLVYSNCPKNALYILHNHTKGKEERTFTIGKNGEQIWW